MLLLFYCFPLLFLYFELCCWAQWRFNLNKYYYVSWWMFWQTNFPEYQGPEKIVIRRYSDFVWLRDRLFEKYKGIFIPPLPEKSAVGNDWIIHTLILFFRLFFLLKLYFQWKMRPWACSFAWPIFISYWWCWEWY